ncbi:hypothetical protein [Caulobacter sp. CCG-8]|uniref:hypothetical protein n=1 Tax=Caulobacter sp. CCG-8 TaxID=3127958 RepID=UPI00307CC9B6
MAIRGAPNLTPLPRGAVFALVALMPVLLLGGTAAIAVDDPTENIRPSETSDLSRIGATAFAEGRLWLLAGGKLSTVTERGGARVAEPIDGKAVAICARSGRLSALTIDSDGRWTLRRRQAGGWADTARISPATDEYVIGLACDGAGAVLLTDRRLVETGERPPRSVALQGEPHGGVTHALLMVGDQLLVGANAGEWGGGLQRIDRRTGRIVDLERNDTGEPCDAVLDRRCAPVNALTPAPWKPGCAVAAVGMVHMLSRGGLVEICGDRIEPIYAKPLPGPFDRPGKPPLDQVAFFGASQVGDTVLAVGIDGLYQLRDRRMVAFTPLPKFRAVDGVRVSFARPGAVLALTDINQSVSLSGSVPLLATRQD